MRSEYVFAAESKLSNRFLLCRVVGKAARQLQGGDRQSPQSINHSLEIVANSDRDRVWLRPKKIEVEPIEVLAI